MKNTEPLAENWLENTLKMLSHIGDRQRECYKKMEQPAYIHEDNWEFFLNNPELFPKREGLLKIVYKKSYKSRREFKL